MHFSYFESLNIEDGDVIFFTDRSGKGYNGVYRGNYNKVSFSFLNFNGSQIEKINLSDIQVLQKAD